MKSDNYIALQTKTKCIYYPHVKIVIRYVRLKSCYLVRVYVYASEGFQENASIILSVIFKNRLQTTFHIFIKIF